MSHDTITRDEVLVALSRHIGGENGASARALVAEIARLKSALGETRSAK